MPPSLKKGDEVRLKDGQRATVAYAPPKGATMSVHRLKINGGKSLTLTGKAIARGDAKRIGSDDGKYVAVDLDKTLAKESKFAGPTVIGPPIPAMVERVKKMLADGEDVRIFTARIANDKSGAARKAIEEWCKKYIGEVLPVTDLKDGGMKVLYDDKARQVEANTGRLVASK